MPLTPTQIATSKIIAQSVSSFPLVISDLISQYMVGYDKAKFELQWSARDPAEYRRQYELIRDALISTDCEPAIKRCIFEMAIKYKYLGTLNKMFDEIRQLGYRINLDFTDLSFLNLKGLNMSGMTAVCAKLYGTHLDNVALQGTDFTGAVMKDSIIESCDFSRSNLSRMHISNSTMNFVTMCHVDARAIVFHSVKVGFLVATGMVTDHPTLQRILDKSTLKTGSNKGNVVISMELFDKNYFDNFVEKNRRLKAQMRKRV